MLEPKRRSNASQKSLTACLGKRHVFASTVQYFALPEAPTSLGTDTQVHWAVPISFLSDPASPWRNMQIFKVMDGWAAISWAPYKTAKIF